MLRTLIVVAVVAACGGVKDDPDTVDAPGGIGDAAPGECAAAGMVCEGGNLVTCDAAGTVISSVACELGCNASAGRCNELAPSNGLATLLDQAAQAPDLVFSGAATIDTDTGAITDGSGPRTPPTATLQQGLPVGVFVVQVKSLVAQQIDVVGTRALAIVSHGDIVLNGVVSVDARRDVNGPGAIASDPTCRGGSGATATSAISGGGGGGFGTAGGAGGTASSAVGGTAGAVVGTIELVPLRGGCPGGHPGNQGPSADPIQSDPGGAGGAVQLVSRTSIAIRDGAFVSANGGGGKGRDVTTLCIVDAPCGDGEGGGSGGAILLEAPRVTIDQGGGLVANGGAGSCAPMGDAQPGQRSDRAAQGARCTGDTGDGGNGAAAALAALRGGNGLNDDPVGGGGGGGAGRIRVNLPLGRTLATQAVLSPAPTVGVLATR